MQLSQEGFANISTSNFYGNSAAFSGGALSGLDNSQSFCTDSYFQDNGALLGGGMCCVGQYLSPPVEVFFGTNVSLIRPCSGASGKLCRVGFFECSS